VIVLRFKVKLRPEKADEAAELFAAVVAPSRAVEGVINFDVARDVTDPDVIIATEVFENDDARDRQEALPEVAAVMAFLPDALAGIPEATVFEVSSSENAM
jgi:quinol monooxygenase YgiN